MQSISGRLEEVAGGRFCKEWILLTYDIDVCMYMTYGSSQRRAESRASEPGPRAAAGVRRTARGGRAVSWGLCDLPTTGLSLSATSSAAEAASAGERGEVGIYGQALKQFDSTSAVVRQRERVVDQQSGQSGLAGTATRRGKAWLSRSQLRPELCGWNMALIVCYQRNWPRSTRHWYP